MSPISKVTMFRIRQKYMELLYCLDPWSASALLDVYSQLKLLFNANIPVNKFGE
jgi:hypothetical protein